MKTHNRARINDRILYDIYIYTLNKCMLSQSQYRRLIKIITRELKYQTN